MPMQQNNFQVCYITMYEDLVQNSRQIYESCGDPIRVAYTEISQIDRTVQLLINQGVKVLIARGGVPDIIKQSCSVPVVKLRYSFLDFFEPVKTAYQISDRAALMGWYKNVGNFSKYRSLLPKNLRYVEFSETTAADCENYIEREVRRMAEQGIRVFVGGGGVARAARRLGVPYVHVDISRESYLDAAEEAFYLLKIYEEKERRYQTIETVLNSVSEGVFTVDQDGAVTNINAAARQILNRTESSPDGRPVLSDIVSDPDLAEEIRKGKKITNRFLSIGNSKILLNSDLIRINRQISGAVITLQQTDVIRNLEKKIRLNAVKSGHYAKYSFDDIAGNSFAMKETKKRAAQYARTCSTTLLSGETGTGKEIFAQSIHNASARRSDPFVAVNCAAIPESLLESELFGYVRGAFTGASSEGKAGIFEVAHRGSIFLDEISEISPKVQARLLRVLQEKEITRVGDDRVIPIDVRVIAASNKNLKAEIAAGRFREDLYYRLCVLTLRLPPLRERPEDIMETLQILIQRHGFQRRAFTPEAERLICAMKWPGNVRELNNFAERLCVLYPSEQIGENFVRQSLEQAGGLPPYRVLVGGSIHRVDGDYILSVLKRNYGNRSKTAKELGISTSTLWRRMREIRPSED